MRIGQWFGILAFAGAIALQGCGSSGAGSCTTTAGGFGYCIDYVGSSFTTSSVQSACSAESGTYSSGACATGTNGTCDFNKGTGSETKWTFTSTGGGDAGTSVSTQSYCTSAGGTFSS
ncbi:MAG: hypothetical protein ACYDCL_09565 [Myxococcales bacterium]